MSKKKKRKKKRTRLGGRVHHYRDADGQRMRVMTITCGPLEIPVRLVDAGEPVGGGEVIISYVPPDDEDRQKYGDAIGHGYQFRYLRLGLCRISPEGYADSATTLDQEREWLTDWAVFQGLGTAEEIRPVVETHHTDRLRILIDTTKLGHVCAECQSAAHA